MNFKKLRKFKKNAKALSPVVASIILIAVTVAVSVVVAAWMGGMTIGLMGNAEQASITNVVLTAPATATVTVQNSGAATVTITSAYIDQNTANMYTIPAGTQVTSIAITKGTSQTFNITAVSGVTFTNTAQYTVKLMTAKGNTITNTATYSH
jgi:flagellin-like protein